MILYGDENKILGTLRGFFLDASPGVVFFSPQIRCSLYSGILVKGLFPFKLDQL